MSINGNEVRSGAGGDGRGSGILAGDGGAGGSAFGSGLFNLNGTVTIQQSSVVSNTATAGAGGVSARTGLPAPSGEADGGGIYHLGYGLGAPPSAALTLINSTVLSNTGPHDIAADKPATVALGAGGGPNSAAVSFAQLGGNSVGSVLIAPGVTVEWRTYLPLVLR